MQATLDVFARERCSAILRTPHASAVAPAMRAAIEGGFRIVEFTLTTPDALEHIAAFSKQPDVLVGAGTVLDLAEAEAAREAGARFLVSPVVDERIIRYGSSYELLVIPGCFTPTEMLAAHRAGAAVIKLFPAPADGPAWIRSCLAPLPFLKIFPTAGVTTDNTHAHFDAGAFGVGFVANLFVPDDLRAGRFDQIRDRARQMITAVRAATS